MDDQRPTIILTSIDRWRREIVVSQTQWMGHVLFQHPELRGQLEALDATLTNPEFVMRDTTFVDRENFYRSGLLPSPLARLYLKVVVEFRHTGTGEVVTAYPKLSNQTRRGAEMAVDHQYVPLRTFHPRWPDRQAIDPDLLVINYWQEIDTLMVDFTGKNPSAVSVPLDVGGDRGCFMLRLDPVTEDVLGLQIEDFFAYAIHRHLYLLDLLDLAILHGITPAEIARLRQQLAPDPRRRAAVNALFDELATLTPATS